MFDYKFNLEDVQLAKLSDEDLPNLANFDCGDRELDRFLREDALPEQRQSLNSTELLYYMGELAAYCSICSDSIRLLPDEAKADGLPRDSA